MGVGESFCALIPPSPSPFSGNNSGDNPSPLRRQTLRLHLKSIPPLRQNLPEAAMDLPHNSSSSSAAAAARAADAAADEEKQNLNGVINSVQKTLGLLHQLHLTVSSFSVSSQLHLLQRLNALVAELDNMQRLADNCNIQVPMEVISLIDEGKNPDEYTRDVINSCISRNQITKGKTDAFKGLRKHLLEELEEAFPDEVETYRAIRASSAAESKRLTQSQGVLPNGDAKVKTEH